MLSLLLLLVPGTGLLLQKLTLLGTVRLKSANICLPGASPIGWCRRHGLQPCYIHPRVTVMLPEIEVNVEFGV